MTDYSSIILVYFPCSLLSLRRLFFRASGAVLSDVIVSMSASYARSGVLGNVRVGPVRLPRLH